MMHYKIIYSRRAISDIEVIYRYIALKSFDLKIASRVVRKIKNTIESLKIFPYRHQQFAMAFNELPNVRQLLIDNYLVLYSINETNKSVAVHGIMPCKQNKGKVIN